MVVHADGGTTQVALGISGSRNRELLASLLDRHEVREIDDAVPEETDVCVVDEETLGRRRDALAAWHDDQYPTFAPALLLVESDVEDPWEHYADALAKPVDSIMRIPSPKSAISARIEHLLEMRDMSRDLASEHRLTERIFDTSPLAKVVLDADGVVVRANRRAAELFGASSLEGRHYGAGEWTAVDEDGAPIPSADLPFERVLETGAPVYGVEFCLAHPDRERTWLSVSMAPIRDETGAVEYVVGALEDVTVRRNQERELERQVDLFEKAQDIADVGAWEYDVGREAMYWTAAVSRIHGVDDDTVLTPEGSLEHFHPADQPVIQRAFRRAVTEGESYDLELRLTDEDGDTRWVRTRGEPQYEDGELVRVRGTMQDITDRKERELELRRMTNAVDRAPIGVSLTDPTQEDNPLVYVNDGFVELTGYSREEVLGRNCRFLQGENTDPETVAEIRAAVDAEEPVSVRLRNYRQDGTEFWNRLEIAPVRDDDGDVVNMIGFQQDVTERVERRRQLNVLDRYLRHNLRNKMNVVQGMADLIREEADPPLTEYAARIDDTAQSLLASMNKERDITELLQAEPSVETVELVSTLRSVVADLRAEHPEATVSLSAPEAVTVRATDNLHAALDELVSNAVEHNHSESPTVTVEVTAGDGEVTVRVTDDGPGIPDVEAEVLTGAKEETAVYHSQGLGLWLVYLVVRRSGGTVRFASGDAGGSVVTVSLTPAGEA